MLAMVKHSVDLRRRGSPQRQRRQFISREKGHFAGLVAGAGRPTHNFTNEKHFINPVDLAGRGTPPLAKDQPPAPPSAAPSIPCPTPVPPPPLPPPFVLPPPPPPHSPPTIALH